MKLLEFQEGVGEMGLSVVSTLDFQRLMGARQKAAQELLGRYVRKGVLMKLRNGLYAVSRNPPSAYRISNALYSPSYVSFESALSYHGLIPETVYAVTAATPKTTREFTVNGTPYIHHHIRKDAFTGYMPIKIRGETIMMAEPEKALMDQLYFARLGRKTVPDRLNLDGISRKKVRALVKVYGNGKFKRFVEDVVRRAD